MHSAVRPRLGTPWRPFASADDMYNMLTAVHCGIGCDVLWGGCPMVTLPLERMASRVAASLCFATGLGHEMVVNSQQVSVICIQSHSCVFQLHSCLCQLQSCLSHFAFMNTLCSCCSLSCYLSGRCGDSGTMLLFLCDAQHGTWSNSSKGVLI